MKDFEIEIIKSLRSIATPALDVFFRIITFLGEQYVLIIVIAILYFLFDKKKAQEVVFAVMTTLCLNNAIKGLIKYERPFVYSQDYEPADIALSEATGYSFPSGHSQNATTLYTSLALTFKKKSLIIIAISLIILIGFSRIYLGVHYPKDVLFGIIFGLACSFFSYFVHKKIKDNFKQQILIYSIALLVFVPFLFILWSNNYQELELVRDFYISFFFSLGYICAIILEHKYVDFQTSKNLKTNLLRLLGAIGSILIIYVGLKVLFGLKIFPQEGNVFKIVFDCIRYFLVSFVGLGLYPLIFKNILFKKED